MIRGGSRRAPVSWEFKAAFGPTNAKATTNNSYHYQLKPPAQVANVCMTFSRAGELQWDATLESARNLPASSSSSSRWLARSLLLLARLSPRPPPTVCGLRQRPTDRPTVRMSIRPLTWRTCPARFSEQDNLSFEGTRSREELTQQALAELVGACAPLGCSRSRSTRNRLSGPAGRAARGPGDVAGPPVGQLLRKARARALGGSRGRALGSCRCNHASPESNNANIVV